MNIQERIAAVEARIAAACARSGRSRDNVHTIAVTKYVSLETAREAVQAGLTRIGENRWQDVKPKWEALGPEVEWHFIGSLQTNKVKDVVGRFPYIHSLDRLSLAREIHKKATDAGIRVKCFIQLNVAGEDTKHGLAPDELFSFCRAISGLSGIEVIGLMTMAPLEAEPEATRPVFRGLRELRDDVNRLSLFSHPVAELSMGMSADFEVAIEEGATYVRLGTVLVGKE